MNHTPCPKCGRPLADDAPMGLCPDCLLAAGFGTLTHEARAFVAPSPDELAPRFPELEILELLGRGGMGAVYKARQKRLDRLVALKILPPGIGGPAFAERFEREARALARLQHPRIVTLYEFGEREGQFYFLMEFVDGLNLRRLLDSGRMEPQQALAIVPQICEALQFAHDRGIVHRDIKPENVLVSTEGHVKIADFGVAKILAGGTKSMSPQTAPEAGQTMVGEVIGTPQYMAPEQISHPRDVDNRADIYALGVVFYQMLTGELPAGKFEPPSRRVAVDVRLDEVVLRALEKNPEARYQQAHTMKSEVETIRATPEAPRSRGLHWMRWAGIAMLATIALGIGGLLLVFFSLNRIHQPIDIAKPPASMMMLPIFVIIFQILFLGTWLFGVIHALRNRALDNTERVLWCIVALAVPALGSVLYFLFAPARKESATRPPPREATPAREGIFGPFVAKSALLLLLIGLALIAVIILSPVGGGDAFALGGLACWVLSFCLGFFTWRYPAGRIALIGTVLLASALGVMITIRSSVNQRQMRVDIQRVKEIAEAQRAKVIQRQRDEMLVASSIPGRIYRVKVELADFSGADTNTEFADFRTFLENSGAMAEIENSAGTNLGLVAAKCEAIEGTRLFVITIKSNYEIKLETAGALVMPTLDRIAKKYLAEHGHKDERLSIQFIDSSPLPPKPAQTPPTAATNPSASLGLRSMKGRYKFADAKIYALATLQFEDGRLAHIGGISTGTTSTPTIEATAIWGMLDGKPRMTLYTPGAYGPEDAAFWMNLNSGTAADPPATFDGYSIIAFAQSAEDRSNAPMNNDPKDFAGALANRKYVGAIGVRSFATQDAMHAFLETARASEALNATPAPTPTPSDKELAQTGDDLRAFLGVNTLRGSYKLPASAVGHYPIALFYANGNLVAKAVGGLTFGEPREGDLQLLWQMKDDRHSIKHAGLVDGESEVDVTGIYPYWSEFSKVLSRYRPPPDKEMHVGDVRILAVLAAANIAMPPDDDLASNAKYMIAIGIVSGPDRKALEAQFVRDQKPPFPFTSSATLEVDLAPDARDRQGLSIEAVRDPARLYCESAEFRNALLKQAKIPNGDCQLVVKEIKNTSLIHITISADTAAHANALANSTGGAMSAYDKAHGTHSIMWETTSAKP